MERRGLGVLILIIAFVLFAPSVKGWRLAHHDEMARDALQALMAAGELPSWVNIDHIADHADRPDKLMPHPYRSCHRVKEYQKIFEEHGGSKCQHEGAEWWAADYLQKAREAFLQGNREEAEALLGYSIHYIQDAVNPPHVFPFEEKILSGAHWDFEGYAEERYRKDARWRERVRNAEIKPILDAKDLSDQLKEFAKQIYNSQIFIMEPIYRDSKGDSYKGRNKVQGLNIPKRGWDMKDDDILWTMEIAAGLVKGAAKWVFLPDQYLLAQAPTVSLGDGELLGSFVIVTDIHIGRRTEGKKSCRIDYYKPGWNDGEPGINDIKEDPEKYLKEFVEQVNRMKDSEKIKFVVVLGDISDSGESSEMHMAKNILDGLNVPYIPLIGNHDVWPYTPTEKSFIPDGDIRWFVLGRGGVLGPVIEKNKALFKNWDDGTRKQLVFNPDGDTLEGGDCWSYFQNFAFDYEFGNEVYHFIVTDWVSRDWTPVFEGPTAVAHTYDFTGGTMQWLRNHLKDNAHKYADGHIIILAHHPPKDGWLEKEKYLGPYVKKIGYWFAGHTHYNKEYTLNGVKVIITDALYPYNDIVCQDLDFDCWKVWDQCTRGDNHGFYRLVKVKGVVTGGDQYPNLPAQAPTVLPGTYSDHGGDPNDPRDCLAIQVSRGQRISLKLTGPRGTDFDLRVYKPGSNFASWESVNNTSQEMIDIDSAPETGRYVICISFASGSGVWKLEIRVESGVSPPQPLSQPPATPTSPPPRPSLRGATTASALVMDVSTSMGWLWQGEVKLESAKRVASQTINLIEQEARASGAGHSLAIVSFSDQANLLLPLTTDYRQARGVVLALSPVASTNLGDGLQMALAELARAPSGSPRYIILLSDGHITSGMSEGEVLAGPVAQARQRKICIHTVGFGDPNYLKEDFLKEISQQSGCGKHLYAENAFELTKAYIKLRHLSLGRAIAEFVSQAKIYQGETLTLGAVSIPSPRAGQEIEELHFTLTWPGSRLQPRLFDPTGVEVTEGYPGAQITYFEQFAHVVVRQPQPGFWRVVIFGEEVPPQGSDFYAVLSTRPGEAGKLARTIPLINPVICIKYPSGEERCQYLFQGNIPTWMIIVLTIVTVAVLVYLKLSGQTP